jgi:radical SAM protein with 4Fe4S-binding SPASM domain
MGCLFLVLTGGEILTRDDFFIIAAHARKKKFNLRLLTNGTLIDKETAKKIKDLQTSLIEVTIYGDKRVYEQITRIPNSYNKVIDGITNLTNQKVQVAIKTPLMSQNFDVVYKNFYALVKKLGVMIRGIDPKICPMSNGNIYPLKYTVNKNQLRKFYEERQKKFGVIQERKLCINEPICESGRTTISISPFGEIKPCIAIHNSALVSINSSIKKIWASDPDILHIRNLKLRDLDIICRRCNLLPFCFRCIGISKLETGDFKKPTPGFCIHAEILQELKYNSFIPSRLRMLNPCIFED